MGLGREEIIMLVRKILDSTAHFVEEHPIAYRALYEDRKFELKWQWLEIYSFGQLLEQGNA